MIEIEDKTKQKQGGSGMGDTMNIVRNVGSVNDEKKSCGEVKNFQGCCSV